MEVIVFLVPLALLLGLIGLLGFLWSLKNGQYDDLEGAAWRAIADDDEAPPAQPAPQPAIAPGLELKQALDHKAS
jgi:cbb3-type cytochrome oxidase maturation protein